MLDFVARWAKMAAAPALVGRFRYSVGRFAEQDPLN